MPLNESLLKQWQAQALTLPQYPNDNFPPSLYYRFLRVLAQQIKPNLSVELGVSGGGGSLHLCLGWPQGRVVGVDLMEDHPDNINHIISSYPNFELWLGDSIELAEDIYKRHGPADILFIDTIHTKERTLQEYEAWQPYLSDRAVMCFDDLLRAEMDGFWEELPEPKLRLDRLHDISEGGFGVKWFG